MVDYDDTRIRLLMAATKVFSEHGYHAATTREICRCASANLAAIHYHFGDKAALYREVFKLPFLKQSDSLDAASEANLTLEESLNLFYRALMLPIWGDQPLTQQFMRLHAREEIDPSGVLGDVVAQAIKPNFERLKSILCKELKLAEADLEIERLAFCLVGMAKIFFHGKCLVNSFSPELLHGKNAIDIMISKLVSYAMHLVALEASMRRS